MNTAEFWPSAGPLSIRSGLFWGQRNAFLNAAVDDVRLYAGPMTPNQVKLGCAC